MLVLTRTGYRVYFSHKDEAVINHKYSPDLHVNSPLCTFIRSVFMIALTNFGPEELVSRKSKIPVFFFARMYPNKFGIKKTTSTVYAIYYTHVLEVSTLPVVPQGCEFESYPLQLRPGRMHGDRGGHPMHQSLATRAFPIMVCVTFIVV